MKNITFLILLFLTIGFSACHKTPSGTVEPDYDISQVSKEYLIFKQGSKWTYQNDSTLQKSSLEVYSTSEEIRTSGGGTGPQYTYKAIWIWFTNNNVNLQRGEIFASNFDVGTNIPNSAERVYFLDGHYKIGFAPFYPFGSKINLGGEEGVFVNKELIPSMTLNGKTYTDVYHSISEDVLQATPDTVFYHFYFAKNFGLIKYVIEKNQSVESVSLVDAQLIQ